MTPNSALVDLANFENSHYHPGRSRLVQAIWFFIGLPLLRSSLIPFSGFRVRLLRAFGSQLGHGCVLKPGLRVKYPWHLRAGRNCWFGEDTWIDNLVSVTLGENVCLSQAVYLCTGNHDWSDPSFGLITASIKIGDGAWIGARATIAPGVVVGDAAVVGLSSVVQKNVPSFEVHSGNPAQFVRHRSIKPTPGSPGLISSTEPQATRAASAHSH